jgi:hypothetical protein
MDLLTKMENSDREVTITVDFGENAPGDKLTALRAALVARGVKEEIVEEVIASHAIANLKVYFRSGAKAGMKGKKDEAPLTDAEIQAKVDKMIPSIAPERDAQTAMKKLETAEKVFGNLSDEEQAAYLEKLQARLAAKREAVSA